MCKDKHLDFTPPRDSAMPGHRGFWHQRAVDEAQRRASKTGHRYRVCWHEIAGSPLWLVTPVNGPRS